MVLHSVLGRVCKRAGVEDLILCGALICHTEMDEACGPDWLALSRVLCNLKEVSTIPTDTPHLVPNTGRTRTLALAAAPCLGTQCIHTLQHDLRGSPRRQGLFQFASIYIRTVRPESRERAVELFARQGVVISFTTHTHTHSNIQITLGVRVTLSVAQERHH